VSFGSYHSLPPDPPKEKYAFGLGLVELGWMLAGVILSYKLFKIVPPLPVKNFLFTKIHALLPLFITAFFAFGKLPQTGLSISEEIVNMIEFKLRNRTLLYRRGKY
jgi:hypothetical protein